MISDNCSALSIVRQWERLFRCLFVRGGRKMDILIGYITVGTMAGLYSVTAASVVIELGSMIKDLSRFRHP